ncbi:MAG: SPOR domain-containing protein [Prevotella sp.]|nr:SPOR domain-containing protein [Prevotella sp.]
MIELERHIEILLLNNDCVIVPNLGGFVAHHREARYDDSDQLFLPPLRTLGFNPKLHLNDSLLAQSYIEAYDISYPDAMNRIEEEVNELKQTLENEGSYELNDIGTLSLNEDGHYEFMPCEAGILTPALYGLSSFDMECVESSTEETAEIVSMEPNVTAEEKPMIPAAVKQEEAEEKQPRTITIRVSTLRNAVAGIAAAILALFLITTPLGRDSKAGFSFNDFEKSWLYRIMPKEKTTTTTDAKLQPEQTAKEATTEAPSTASVQAPVAPQEVQTPALPQHYWSIVLASKVSMKNAKAFVEQLSNDGFNAEVLVQKSGNRVIYGKYNTEKEAYAALGQLRNQKHFLEAWVYEVKR